MMAISYAYEGSYPKRRVFEDIDDLGGIECKTEPSYA
jgi:hypothetical protein